MSDSTPKNDAVYKVSMRLRQIDVDRVEKLQETLSARSKADAISQALAIATMMVEHLRGGEDILIRKPNSDVVQKLVIPQLMVAA